MKLPRRCCTVAGLDCGCTESCNFATTYLVSGMQGTFAYDKVAQNDCPSCAPFSEYDYDLTWVQNGQWLVTKYTISSGNCCYAATGYVTVTGTLNITVTTEDTNGTPCITDELYYFSETVPACLSIRCKSAVPCSGAPIVDGWIHTLQLCDFVITESHEEYINDCEQACTGSDPFSLQCVGCTMRWGSPMGSLSTGTKRDLGCFGGGDSCVYVGHDPNESNSTNCFEVSEQQYGPFAIIKRDEGSAQDPHLPCSINPITDNEAYLITALARPYEGLPCCSQEVIYDCWIENRIWGTVAPTYI